MNLHEWITARVAQVEARARNAADCTRASRWEPTGSLIVTVPEEAIGDGIIEAAFHSYDGALVHAAHHDPDTVLRRCEADRRILARHRLPEPDDWMYPACEGCGTTGDRDDLVTDNVNDCPELLDLAHAHGITEVDLAGLDRPESAPRPIITTLPRGVTPAITTDQVPLALRGARWRRHRH